MSKAERTRAYIIERAAPVVNQKGYQATSLSDITEATGLTKGSIYGNFTSKEEVALAVFDHNWQQVINVVSAEMARYLSSRDKLMVYANMYRHKDPLALPTGGCPLLNTSVEADDTDPQLRARAQQAFEVWKANIISLLQRGIKYGEFKQDIDVDLVAMHIISMVEGSVMVLKLTGEPRYQKMLEQNMELLLASLT